MSVELPQSGDVFISMPPRSVQNQDPELYEYLVSLKRNIEDIARGLFDNDVATVNSMNAGTSGTFTISSGGSIVVTSGIVITVTS